MGEQRLLWGGRAIRAGDNMQEIVAGQAPVRLVRVDPTWHVHLDIIAESGLMLGLDAETRRTVAMRHKDVDRNSQGFRQEDQGGQLELAQLFRDRGFVLAAVQEQGGALLHTSQELRDDREVVLCALRENGSALDFVSEKLKSDREVVLTAVRQNGLSLQFAVEELRGDREVLDAALEECGEAFRFASEELRLDRKVAMGAVLRTPSALPELPSHFQNSHDFILEAVRGNAEVLGFVKNAQLCKDQQIVQAKMDYWQAKSGQVDTASSPKRAEPFLITMERNRASNYEWQMACGRGGAIGLRKHPPI